MYSFEQTQRVIWLIFSILQQGATTWIYSGVPGNRFVSGQQHDEPQL
jgi:hypothetical protein